MCVSAVAEVDFQCALCSDRASLQPVPIPEARFTSEAAVHASQRPVRSNGLATFQTVSKPDLPAKAVGPLCVFAFLTLACARPHPLKSRNVALCTC